MKRSPLVRKTPLRAKGGFARAAKLSPEVRREIATKAAVARWSRPADAPRAVMALARPAAEPVPKEGRHISEAWRRMVAELPCVFCGKASQAAHRNEGKAMGLKTDDCLTAALCQEHHAEIDQGKALLREERRARMDRAIVLTVREAARAGKLVTR